LSGQVSVRGLHSVKYHDKLLDPELERNEDRADVTLAQVKRLLQADKVWYRVSSKKRENVMKCHMIISES
jgi:hypothetical protein